MSREPGIVVMPGGARGRIDDPALQSWLSRGRIVTDDTASEALCRVVEILGLPSPRTGLGAIRFWGQIGERSSAWIAAADPVHLQTRLRDLRLRHVVAGSIEPDVMQLLFDALQRDLGTGGDFAFVRIGDYGYLRALDPIPTGPVSSAVLDGAPADTYRPSGDGADRYHRLLAESQMILHGHEANKIRADAGLPVINSLWIWGGGFAPEPAPTHLPPLFADDPLFRGYWVSRLGDIRAWTGNFEACAEAGTEGFVAVPTDVPAHLESSEVSRILRNLHALQKRRRLDRLVLLFRDGVTVRLGRRDALRFWRRRSALFAAHDDHG